MRILVLLFMVLALPVAAAAETARPALRQAVTVEGDVVRLGDIFDGIGDKAATAVLRAPAPGRRLVLEAEWLLRAARAYDVAWRPLSRTDRVVVRRASVQLDRSDIEALLLPELARHGITSDAEIELSPRDLRLHLPADAPDAVEVREVSVDERTGRFAAVLVTPTRSIRIDGRAHETVEVPVVTEVIRRGDVIAAADVAWQRLRSSRVQGDVLRHPGELVGKAARFGLRPGEPVRTRDVEEPVVVPRGATVTMVLRQPGMTLTAQGRALEDGAEGAVIRVANQGSNITVKARVEGPNRVAALPPSMAAIGKE